VRRRPLTAALATLPAASLALVPAAAAQVTEERSWARWFVLAIAALLLVLALQVVIAIRRDRRLLHELEDEIDQDEAPAHVEDADDSEYAVDALGDVDDLGVHDYAAPTPKRPGKR
jgi:hypothetical protein